MRLLTYDGQGKLHVTRDLGDDVPPYAILSHTWGADEEEVTFHELRSGLETHKAGYAKINFCGRQAQKDKLQHFWVDTCCIDKANHVELSEAITSMFRWYQNAEVCYVYLSDVSSSPIHVNDVRNDHLAEPVWESSFRNSRWFTRGWTLQELLAPKKVVFFSKEGQRIGTKSDLEVLLHKITTIPIAALGGQPLSQFSETERMRWTKGRVTKKKEDQAYCLLGIFNVYMPLIYGEGDHAFVRLTEEIHKLPKVTFTLRVVDGATFDAYDQAHRGCHPATRVDLLQSVRDWAHDMTAKSIFWLSGMAGTGKSTISYTVAKWLADLGSGGDTALGASFFFKRGEGDRASAALLFPTIASQLAAKIGHFDVFLAQAVKAHPQICTKSLSEQFNKLIYEPLSQLRNDIPPSTFVVVIDALDECNNEADIHTVLQLWSYLPATSRARLRLFLTSRPELVIRLGFKKMSAHIHQDVVLHEVPQPVIQHDILAFLTDALAEIREEYNLEPAGAPLADDWPGSSLLQKLTSIAVPLFIVAATIYCFIRDADRPQEGLEMILKSRNSGYLSDMGKVYGVVLQATISSVKGKPLEEKVYREFRLIVGAIICLAEPLSRIALAALLGISSDDVQLRLRSLHALLQIPQGGDAVVRPLHLSFGEYLNSEEVQHEPFGIDATATHHMLWNRCLQLLSGPEGLRENICGLIHPGQLRHEVTPNLVSQHLPPAVQYACRYWVYHVWSSAFKLSDEDEIHNFLQKHFLHWLEALSFLGRLADTIEMVIILQSRIMRDNSGQVAAFLEDARRFVLANRFVGELAPLQLYSSAIAFAPRDSIVRNVCGHLPAWISQGPMTPSTWSLELQKLEGHTASVSAVAFSPDGTLLASASQDHTVRLWQVSTGREIQMLEGHSRLVRAVAFSPDGSLLASVSHDRTVRLWQVSTGQEIQKLERHTRSVSAVAFSPDGSLLASASEDDTVRLWQVGTGREIQKLEGHTGSVNAVAFSPNGSLLASASHDHTVRLWQVSTGQEIQKLEGHTSSVRAVAYSPDGSLLASASEDDTLRLWQVSTGREIRELEGHTNWVRAVAFSPDGCLLASASEDKTVRLWQVSTFREIQKLEGHTRWVNAVAFSTDGSLLASASEDDTVRLWQVSTGREIQKLEGHTSSVRAVAFSPDCILLASASYDDTVRLWQVSTGRDLQKLEGHTGSVSAVAFSPNSTLLASASEDKTVRLWQVSTCREIQKLEGHTRWVNAVAFSTDGSLLASASEDGTVRLWQVSTGREIQKLEGHTGSVNAVAFSPDCTLLASASYDDSVRLWQVSTGRNLQKLEGHTDSVKAVAFSPDGTLVASASFDDTVRLWQVSTGQEVQRLEDVGFVSQLSFSSDNRTLITDRGYFQIHEAHSLQPSSYPVTHFGIILDDDWIQHRGEKLLWLPQEYRSRIWAVYGNVIGIGRRDGFVNILRIDYP